MQNLSSFVFLCFMTFIFPAMYSEAQENNFDKMISDLTKGTVPFAQPEEVTEDILILDARDLKEFEVSRIPGALRIGYTDFNPDVMKDVEKDREIIVYCSVGYRSEKIAEVIRSMGFKHIKNLYGGIFHWMNTDHELIDDGGITNRVHTYNEEWSKWLKKGEKVFDD